MPPVLAAIGGRLPVAAMLLVLVGQALIPTGWSRYGVPVAGVGLLAGLPHGAVDHLVPSWLLMRRLPPATMGALLAGYLMAAALMVAVLHIAPLPALVIFLALSLVHFGTGELAYDQLRTPVRRPVKRLSRDLQVFAWGGVVVLLPLARWPREVAPVLDSLAPGAAGLLSPGFRGALLVAVLLAVFLTTGQALLGHRLRYAAELALLASVLLLVNPLVAFAVYFGLWHSLRHVVRLLAANPANHGDLARGAAKRPLLRFARQALLPTAASVTALGVLWSMSGAALLTSDLRLLAGLTVPHMLIVAWLDHRKGCPPVPARP